MKRPDEILEQSGWLAERQRAKEEAEVYLARLSDAAGIVASLVDRWAAPSLAGEDVACDTDIAPAELRAAFERSGQNDHLAAAAEVLRGRALARALLALEPSWPHWDSACDLRPGWSLEGLIAEIRARSADPQLPRWIRLLVEGAPDPAAAVFTVGEKEPLHARAQAAQWRARPTALDHRLFRSPMPTAPTRLALHVLLEIDPSAWWEALARASLPGIVAYEVERLARDPDQLLTILVAAPPSMTESGSELPTVAATLLARSALECPARIEGALQHRVRLVQGPEQRAKAQAELDEYRADGRERDITTVVDAVLSRVDGRALGWTLLLGLVNRACRQQPDDRSDSTDPTLATLSALAAAMKARFEEPVGPTHAWLGASDAGRAEDPIIRWLTLVLPRIPGGAEPSITPSDADELMTLLQEDLQHLPNDGYRFANPFEIPSWVIPLASVVLASAENPACRLREGFGALERERMHERSRTDSFKRSVGSRFLTYLGLAALAQPAIHEDKSKLELARVAFECVRVIWLRSYMEIGGDISNLVVYAFAWLTASLGASSEFFRDALRYVVSDPSLALRVAHVAVSNGATREEVVKALEFVGAPLSRLLAQVEAAPEPWDSPVAVAALKGETPSA